MMLKKSLPLVITTLCLIVFASVAYADTIEAMTIQVQPEVLRVVNGRSVMLDVWVKNTGVETQEGLLVNASLPYKWAVESCVPESLTLQPDEKAAVKLQISIPASQNASTHTVILACGNDTAKSNEILIPVAVTSDIAFLWYALGAIVLTALITLILFRKFGRR